VLHKLAKWVGFEPRQAPEDVTGPDDIQISDLEVSNNYAPEITIEWIVESSESSVRLSNAIKHADFPFRTVAEYLANPNPLDAVIRVQNIGRKTAEELNALIKNFVNNPYNFPKENSQVEAQHQNILSLLRDEISLALNKYSFPRALFDVPLATRLENVLKNIDQEKNEFKTLADCGLNYQEFREHFLRQANFGRKTLRDLESVLRSVSAHYLTQEGISQNDAREIAAWLFNEIATTDHHKIEAFLNFFKNKSISNITDAKDILTPDNLSLLGVQHNEELNAEIIKNLIKELVNDREYDVLVKRFALNQKVSETLDEVAKDYNCTRERIRQIEKKALGKLKVLKKTFHFYLEKESRNIQTILFEDIDYFSYEETTKIFKRLPGEYRIGIQVSYGDIDAYLKAHYTNHKMFWINKTDPQRLEQLKHIINSDTAGKPLEKRISEVLNQLKWPITVNALAKEIIEYSADVIEKELRNTFDAEIVNGDIRVFRKNIRASQRVIMALRYAGRALSLSEVRSYHKQLFAHDVLEHHVGAILGRLEEALIVERGKYNLYENLELSSKEVETIRQECFAYLNERKIYVSAKRIFDDIYIGRHTYNAEFNPYMLMGILQDDGRFVCKRGLMLGLSTFSEEDFVGLNEKIYKIVDDYGPIDLKEIQEHLSSDRKVLDVTVLIVLDDSPQHIKIAPATYDRIDRVIGDHKDCCAFKFAIEIALIDGDLSIFALQNRLEAVGINFDKNVLVSWLDKQENIERRKTTVHLVASSMEVTEHNEKYLHLFSTPQKDTNRMFEDLKIESPLLAPIDYRLTEKYPDLVQKIDEDNELNNLFREFEF